jgi:hypothetical protein
MDNDRTIEFSGMEQTLKKYKSWATILDNGKYYLVKIDGNGNYLSKSLGYPSEAVVNNMLEKVEQDDNE